MAKVVATATVDDGAASAVERKVPTIAPEAVVLDSQGFAWWSAIVHCPPGMIADDLRDPTIWRRVQATAQTALLKYAHLFILGADESWFARAVVCHATNTEAHLVIEKVGTFRSVGQALYREDDHQVVFEHGVFHVRSIRSGGLVDPVGYTREADAIDAIRKMRPVKVGTRVG